MDMILGKRFSSQSAYLFVLKTYHNQEGNYPHAASFEGDGYVLFNYDKRINYSK